MLTVTSISIGVIINKELLYVGITYIYQISIS